MSLFENYGPALVGGVMIGLAASLLLLTHGRIAGIAGLFGGLFLPGHDGRSVRLWFVGGLVLAGVALVRIYPMAFSTSGTPALPLVAAAGLLVGYGTRLGGGCTSGHGVCGISRFSLRSIAATLIFMVVGMATVFVARHWGHDLGGPS